MTRERLFTVPVGTTLDQAREILHRAKVEKLLVVDADYRLKGLITVKDIQKAINYSERVQGLARPPVPRRGRGHRARCRAARRGAVNGLRRRPRRRHRPRALAGRARHGEGPPPRVPRVDLVAGNVATR